MSELEANGLKNEEILRAMGMSLEEAVKVDKELTEKNKKSRSRDSRVCLCGHGAGKHNVYAGILECKPTAMRCPCKKLRPVLETSDTRFFLRKTEGGGAMHALSRGVASAASSGQEVRWIEDIRCDSCGSTNPPIVPVPVSQQGNVRNEATGYDALLCASCRTGRA